MSRKQKKADGAPAYIQLYTTLMILLLAFFMVLSTLSKNQEAGFKRGIGDVRDAFGIAGGIGFLRFHFFRSKAVNPTDNPTTQCDAEGIRGIEFWRVRGSGGSGQSDADVEKGLPECFRVIMPHPFPEASAEISPEMSEYLDLSGTVLAMHTDLNITIRQYSGETGDPEADGKLAHDRAVAVMRFFHRFCGLASGRMTAAGYANPDYLRTEAGAGSPAGSQCLVFDLYREERDSRPPAGGVSGQ